VRPQVGQAMSSGRLGRRSRRVARISQATSTSREGSAASETRMVSPMPSASSAPKAVAERMAPVWASPACVTPRWRG